MLIERPSPWVSIAMSVFETFEAQTVSTRIPIPATSFPYNRGGRSASCTGRVLLRGIFA